MFSQTWIEMSIRTISNAVSRSYRESRGKCVKEIGDSKQIDVLLFQRLGAFLEDQAAKRACKISACLREEFETLSK